MKYCTACGSKNFEEAHFCEKCGNPLNQFSDIVSEGMPNTEIVVGKTCPFCQYPIKPGEMVTVCPACGVPHHAACWIENGSSCTTFGCTGSTTSANQNVNESQSFESEVSETDCQRVTAYSQTHTTVSPNITQSGPKNKQSHGDIVKYCMVALIIGLGAIYLFLGIDNATVQPRKVSPIKPAQQIPASTTTTVPETRQKTPVITNNVVRQVVVDFYNQVGQKNYSVAWNYLSDDWKQSTSYLQWVKGYENTLSTSLKSAEVVGNVTEHDDVAKVRVRLTARDRQGSRVLAQTFSGNITLIRTGTKWSLAESDVKQENYWYE